VVDEVELEAKRFGLLSDVLYALSVVKVKRKYLATLKKRLDAPWPLPLRAFLEDKGRPGLPTRDKSGQGFRGYLLNIGTQPGADDPDFGTWIAKLIDLITVLEFG
jgi:hypothetical protein